jgi:hypothetical protein
MRDIAANVGDPLMQASDGKPCDATPVAPRFAPAHAPLVAREAHGMAAQAVAATGAGEAVHSNTLAMNHLPASRYTREDSSRPSGAAPPRERSRPILGNRTGPALNVVA